MDKQQLARPYMWSVIALGAPVILYSASRLPLARLDLNFVILAAMVAVGSRVAVPITRVSGRITVSDTFVFLSMLLYGGEAAVVLAAVEGVCSTLWISKRALTIVFNAAVLACSAFVTVCALRLGFGSIVALAQDGYSANLLAAICVMALAQYLANTILIAGEKSFKLDAPFWKTWKTYYLWTSMTFLAGASAAGITSQLVRAFGFPAVFTTVPIIAVIYLTYQTNLKNIEAAAAHAEQAERHVKELSLYIEELKQSEEEREKILLREQAARSEAEAANRLKDEFLATLSHELRTPLTAIVGWVGLLRAEEYDRDVVAEALETIERNARSQSQLIDDLLDVSRIISGKLLLDVKETDLSSVVADAIGVVRPAANAKGIEITYTPADGRALISGDAKRLQQIAWNLLSNAVKFTPEGGRVEVSTEREGAQLRLVVRDTGRGIAPDFLPCVFDRFRQADSTTTRRHGGLGLGLAIVRHLVELHGGTVGADSEGAGRGSTFSVSFPALAPRPCTNEACRGGDAVKRRGGLPTLLGLRVMVVEDEDDTRLMMSKVIERSGAEVVACASAREALEALARWKPDVLMSDIGMPGEDGYALIRKVRALSAESGGRVPAAALTAYAREEDRQRVLEAGFQMHVAKPVGLGDLITKIADLAGRTA
ncbi:MAG TPA: ATP-binding protein [Pyrinomonadaceae bacterium]|jgi:signal transduction histidine kinase|nr:ATP-binding protein [Pyrinomonadaceae bacterium]